MNLHEYQAKQCLKKYGVPVPRGRLVEEGEALTLRATQAAEALAAECNTKVWVVKAQIHAGGRGKAGGVKVCRSIRETVEVAQAMLKKTLVTPQTGPEGKKVHQVWIEEGAVIAREFYLGIVLDRALSQIVFMASTEGGVEIEEIAATQPEKIFRLAVDPTLGFQPFHARKLAQALGLPAALFREATSFLRGLYTCFLESDAALIEVNPLIFTQDRRLVALDAKMSLDDNALFRQPEILAMRDTREENPQDVEASRYELAYIALQGNIGCLVNGAGLAMATLDIIQLHGGRPANFLDVGGGASREKVSHAFQIILKDPQVKAILVNIFGGIMKCDVIAEGILAAARDVSLKVPLVVRLQGTHVEQGRALLAHSGLKIIPADSLTEAAQKVVAAVRTGAGG